MNCKMNCLECDLMVCVHDVQDRKEYVKDFQRKKERERHARYYQKHREEIIAKNKEYNKNNSRISHISYEKNKQKIKERNHLNYLKNREKRMAYAKEYYYAHKDEINEQKKQKYKERKMEVNEEMKKNEEKTGRV